MTELKWNKLILFGKQFRLHFVAENYYDGIGGGNGGSNVEWIVKNVVAFLNIAKHFMSPTN